MFGAGTQLGTQFADLRHQILQRLRIYVVSRAGGRIFQRIAQLPHLLMGVRQQVRHLVLQGARIDDFAQRRIRRQRQQVAGDIESPRLERSFIRVLFHVGGLGSNVDQVLRHVQRKRVVLGKQEVHSLPIQLPPLIIRSEIRCVVPALAKVLITRRPLLPIPALLVGQFNRRQNRKPLDGQREMRQISNRAVAVLEVKSVEKLFRFLGADLAQGFLHRKGRAGIFGHGISLNFRLYAEHGKHFRGRRSG